MKKIRLSTLLLLVVIAALAITLFVERRRSARELDEVVGWIRAGNRLTAEPSEDIGAPAWAKGR